MIIFDTYPWSSSYIPGKINWKLKLVRRTLWGGIVWHRFSWCQFNWSQHRKIHNLPARHPSLNATYHIKPSLAMRKSPVAIQLFDDDQIQPEPILTLVDATRHYHRTTDIRSASSSSLQCFQNGQSCPVSMNLWPKRAVHHLNWFQGSQCWTTSTYS